MHHLLKRQLKKTGAIVDKAFLELVNQAYISADEDRNLLEHSLDISSKEMRDLYEELKRTTQEKIRRTEKRYETMTTALKDHYFFYAHDLEGDIVYVSDSIYDILGYSVDEFLQHYSTYLTDEKINKNVNSFIQKALNGEQQEPYIISIYHKDKSVHYLEVTEFPVYNEEEKIVEIEGIARDITSQYLIQKKLDYISQHDTLTGILNRLSLYNKLEFILSNSKRNHEHFAVLFLDLDNFKEINDSLGHDIGDLLLQESVLRIQSLIRENDIFARIGGDEFVIILTNIKENSISPITRKILYSFRTPFLLKEQEVKISASIGISIYPEDASNLQSLLKFADEAMYKTKEQGRDSFTYYRELHS